MTEFSYGIYRIRFFDDYISVRYLDEDPDGNSVIVRKAQMAVWNNSIVWGAGVYGAGLPDDVKDYIKKLFKLQAFS